MAQVPQDQWDRVYHELVDLRQSRSPLRHLGEGKTDTWSGFGLNTDGSEHLEICRLLAGYGHPPTLALLREVAGADPVKYPDRQGDRLIAQAILADVTSVPVTTVVNNVAPAAAVRDTGELDAAYAENARLRDENARLQATVVPVGVARLDVVTQAMVDQASVGVDSTGQLIGQAYDALDKLRLADALPIESRAPLAALVSVLQTKNGSSL